MRVLQALMLWIPPILFLAIALSCIATLTSPVPQLKDLSIVEGLIVNAVEREYRSGKTKNCDVVVTVKSSNAGAERVNFHCAESTRALSEHLGEEIKVWLEPVPWYRFEKSDYLIFQVEVAGSYLVDYAEIAPRYKSSKWLVLILLFICLGYSIIYGFLLGCLPSYYVLKSYFSTSSGNKTPFELIETHLFCVEHCADNILLIRERRSLYDVANIIFLILLSISLYFMGVFFLLNVAGVAWVFFLLGFVALLVSGFLASPFKILVDKSTGFIGQIDYFCDPVMHEEMGVVKSVRIAKFEYKNKKEYFLIVSCENFDFLIARSKDVDAILDLKCSLDHFLMYENDVDIGRIDVFDKEYFKIKEVYPFLSGPPGILVIGLTAFLIFFNLIG